MVSSAEQLEPHGFLAYEALVLLQQSMTPTEKLAKYRELFLKYFHGFGDMDPDDAFDVSDG
jgi:hypothetical protein